MNKIKKILPLFLLCLVISFIIFPSNILALSDFEPNKDVDFTLDYQKDGKNLPGATFDIYKVADIDEDSNIKLREDFSNYPVDFNKAKQNEWNDYALTLKGYVQRDKVKPMVTGMTDDRGIYKSKLKTGLYLVDIKPLTIDNYTYESSPFLVLLPSLDKETSTWNYDVISKPKIKKDEKKDLSKKVIKVWDDKGYEKSRPKDIKIELLANGNLKEVVTLSEKNSWQHTWSKLDGKVNWTVVEKNVDRDKYKVSISEEGNTFIIKNTYKVPKVPPKEPPKTSQKPTETLPQTGQLWWPVFFLVGIGSIMIVLGFVQNRRKEVDKWKLE